MKKIVLLMVCLFLIKAAQSQVVTRDVHFDNYTSASSNDLTNHFSGNTTLYQQQTGGITGGCAATPDSNNWGNDLAYYCAKYKANSAVTTFSTSIAFKYDSTLYNASGLERMCTIWLVPSADFNHYMISSVDHDKKITVLSYSYSGTSLLATNFADNHWYKLQVNLTVSSLAPNYNLGFGALVFDIGANGTSSPTLLNSKSGGFADMTLAIDTNISVGFTGTRYGGVACIDDFHFEGIKNSDVCPTSSIAATELNELVSIKYFSDILSIDNRSSDLLHAYIYDLNGRLILCMPVHQGINQISTMSLTTGLYIYHIQGSDNSITEKLIVKH
jgi:hypothetical protein